MSDEQLFFVVLLLLYIAEGIHLVPQKSIVFKSHFGSYFRWRFPAGIIGGTNAGILFSNPLPPFGSYFVISPWAVSISPHGVLSHVLPASNAIYQMQVNGRLHRFDDIDTISTKSDSVFLNGVAFVKCASDSAAKEVSEFLRTLVSLPFLERESFLESHLRMQFDTGAVESAHKTFKDETLLLRIICHLQFLVMFVLFPVWAFYFGFAFVILLFLAGIIVISLFLGFVFYITHLSLFGSEKSGRLKKTFAMAFYPPAGIRSVDHLSLRYFREFNMVAVSSVLCKRGEFQKLAFQTLRDLRHPVPGLPPNFKDEALETESWWRSKMEKTLTRFMEENGVSTDLMSQKRHQVDELAVSFCPRCLCEYALLEGVCPDCRDVELVTIARDKHTP